LTPEQQRLRRLLARPELDERLAARLTQIDYDREMALVLTETTALSDGEIFARGAVDGRSGQRIGRVRHHAAAGVERTGGWAATDGSG
jgi:dephospho-CoA kinase